MAVQDFTTYTEVDPNSRIAVSASRVTWTGITANEDAYVYRDFGVKHFAGNFVSYLTINTTASAQTSEMFPWAMTNSLDDIKGIADASGNLLCVRLTNPSSPDELRIVIQEYYGGTQAESAAFYTLTRGTNYYLKIRRDEDVGTYGTFYCDVFPNSSRVAGEALANLTITLHAAKIDYRYVHGAITRDNNVNNTQSGYSQDLQVINLVHAGYIWMEDENLRGFEENAVEDTYLHTRDVDDTPVNGVTIAPISSNWAFDHVGSADPHTGYMLESNIGTGSGNYPIMDTAAVDNDYAKFTGTGFEGIAYADVLADLSNTGTANFDWNGQGLIETGTITAASSVWNHEHDLFATSLDPGASGATRTSPDANTLGGWQMNAVGETLYFEAHMEAEWDAASDLIVNAWWEVNVDNTGGTATDTADLQLVVRYKGEGNTAIKTQTVEVATTVGASAQYKQYKTVFTIDHDGSGSEIASLDILSFALNLETDTSEVDDIILNLIELRYATTKPSLEA
ncbi:hypothetical protein LCGC14_0349640 [marine sediment metagenome]|uniref:Uncharacterized protein n=1 Tax=marine sediment metagenome TaxID=412755 RepID=A0A0F9TU00_9ZZZZ